MASIMPCPASCWTGLPWRFRLGQSLRAPSGVQHLASQIPKRVDGRGGQAFFMVSVACAGLNVVAAKRQHRRWGCQLQVTRTRAMVISQDVLPGGLFTKEHVFKVPLDYNLPAEGNPHLEVFVREIVLQEKAAESLPVLIFLQGGPGFPSARPTATGGGGWLGTALKDFRVLLLDQRGTGRSSPVTAQTLQHMSPDTQVQYLTHFRADSIVRDCEMIRQELGLDKISLLGQSFGGFCALTYLSFFPSSLAAVYMTGGLAPVLAENVDDVYRCTYRRVLERNRRYYARYPGDVHKVREIMQHLVDKEPVLLPNGGRLTARRFLSLGLLLGSGDGLEQMHWLVESAFIEVQGRRELDSRFLVKVEAMHSFDTNPIYWLLHESIYCGPKTGASQWSAMRVLNEEEFKTAFDFQALLADPAEPPIMMTGEMVYPWFSDDFGTLNNLADAADKIACKTDWSPLYCVETLKDTQVPVAAAVYYEDMYVELSLSEQTARLLGDNCKVWVTNEYQHSGIRDDGARIFDVLTKMTKNQVNIPS